MVVGKGTIWGNFLQPVVQLLINEAELNHPYKNIDWELESSRYRNPQIAYPEYYAQQDFYGIAGGYLNPRTAIVYDRLTPYLLPPQETLVRLGLIDRIQGAPQRILDLGCGTGTTTQMLQDRFPQASITGMDLSPYMLTIASHKTKQKNPQAALEIHWQQGNGEHTGFPNGYFDLITTSLLFHETPVVVAQGIIKECFRLLKGGGQLLILDHSQPGLRRLDWLQKFLDQPQILQPSMKNYAIGSLDAWLGAAGFVAVSTQEIWLVHQLTTGFKPQPIQDSWTYPDLGINDFLGGFASPS